MKYLLILLLFFAGCKKEDQQIKDYKYRYTVVVKESITKQGITGTISGHFNNVPFSKTGNTDSMVVTCDIIENVENSVPYKVELNCQDSSRWNVEFYVKFLSEPGHEDKFKQVIQQVKSPFKTEGYIGVN